MWLIIGTISFVVTYEILYSSILFLWGDKRYCHILQNYNAWAFSTITSHSFQYVLWYYPVFWLFWPPKPSFCRKKPKNKEDSGYSQEKEEEERTEDDEEYGNEEEQQPEHTNLNSTDSSSLMFFGSNVGPQNGLVFQPDRARFSGATVPGSISNQTNPASAKTF